jgi:hypothetical protein
MSDTLHARNQRIQAGRISERELMKAVIACAERLGWVVAHINDDLYALAAREGRQDALVGAKGLPDLVLARNGVTLLVELKSERGRVRPEQAAWIEASGGYVWRPSHWLAGDVERVLRGEE